jgi:hypothetical protein
VVGVPIPVRLTRSSKKSPGETASAGVMKNAGLSLKSVPPTLMDHAAAPGEVTLGAAPLRRELQIDGADAGRGRPRQRSDGRARARDRRA